MGFDVLVRDPSSQGPKHLQLTSPHVHQFHYTSRDFRPAQEKWASICMLSSLLSSSRSKRSMSMPMLVWWGGNIIEQLVKWKQEQFYTHSSAKLPSYTLVPRKYILGKCSSATPDPLTACPHAPSPKSRQGNTYQSPPRICSAWQLLLCSLIWSYLLSGNR